MPLENYGIKCISMGFLMEVTRPASTADHRRWFRPLTAAAWLARCACGVHGSTPPPIHSPASDGAEARGVVWRVARSATRLCGGGRW